MALTQAKIKFMKILGTWRDVANAARTTIRMEEGEKEPSSSWKKRILLAEHSPIRKLFVSWKWSDLPYWVSVHLCRHIHAQPYVKSQRNDRQSEYDRNSAPQNAPVCMIWDMNAEELMTIANKRLCRLASAETREVVQKMCDLVIAEMPEFKSVLVPNCVYGKCHEMYPCGKKNCEE